MTVSQNVRPSPVLSISGGETNSPATHLSVLSLDYSLDYLSFITILRTYGIISDYVAFKAKLLNTSWNEQILMTKARIILFPQLIIVKMTITYSL